ncbi:TPA: ion transporter [Candidatus Latescibacteria bacterium]|nr:ion transporter [Candidatus Latescibacterota bacterium]
MNIRNVPSRRNVPEAPLRRRLHEIIFEADTPAGKAFDEVLIVSIVLSVIVVMLDSVASVSARYGETIVALEWGFTILFSVEYVLRLYAVRLPRRYAHSFFGVVDLLAVVPTYVSLVLPGSQYLLVIRVLRLLRIFRVLKLAQYLGEANLLLSALRASRRKIAVFLFAVLTIVVICGSVMYAIEGGDNGFTSIPRSVYWAIVTLTTVGYGDISPHTELGQAVAAVIMILGYGIIVVPTGIVTSELTHGASTGPVSTHACPSCGCDGHVLDPTYCYSCGARMNQATAEGEN